MTDLHFRLCLVQSLSISKIVIQSKPSLSFRNLTHLLFHSFSISSNKEHRFQMKEFQEDFTRLNISDRDARDGIPVQLVSGRFSKGRKPCGMHACIWQTKKKQQDETVYIAYSHLLLKMLSSIEVGYNSSQWRRLAFLSMTASFVLLVKYPFCHIWFVHYYFSKETAQGLST